MLLPGGPAFEKLDDALKNKLISSLQERKNRYIGALHQKIFTGAKFILLGDTPGPGRPTALGYHHTPFYSVKNSSLWINKLLAENHIEETDLYWFNTTLADGTALDPSLIEDIAKKNSQVKVICLGGRAEIWLLKTAGWTREYHKVLHPQAWKRFHSGKPYPLIDHLKST